MNAIYPHRHHLSAKARTFIDLLVRHSAEQLNQLNPYAYDLLGFMGIDVNVRAFIWIGTQRCNKVRVA